MHPRLPRLALAALLALAPLAAGCGTAGLTAPTALSQADADDVALQVGAAMGADNGGMMGTLGSSTVPTATRPAPVDLARASAVSNDTTFVAGGMTWHIVRAFYDAGGGEMAQFDPVLTTRMLTMSTAAGSFSGPRFSATRGFSSSLDARGISSLQDTLRFSGVANDTCQSAFVSMDSLRTCHFYMESAGALMDVRWLKPVADHPWPISGSAAWRVKADRLRSGSRSDVAAHLVADVTVTFDGTRYARVTVNGLWTYVLDLQTGTCVRATA